MNYYPNNFYGNYPYGNTYPQISNITTNSFNQNLFSKIVDGEEVVKATEVPFGGYGVFPKADLTELYVKSWNNDGTTKIVTYKPIVAEEEVKPDYNQILLEKMTEIENKLNNLMQPTTPTRPTTVEKRKELNVNAY